MKLKNCWKNMTRKEFSSDYGNEIRDPFMVYRQTRMNIYAVYAILACAYLYKGDADSKSRPTTMHLTLSTQAISVLPEVIQPYCSGTYLQPLH